MSCRLDIPLLSAALLVALAPATPALSEELPQVKVSASNAVPECVTPGRLMSYVRSRNEKLDPKFDSVAIDYMRNGEELGIRWDYAFFQMMLETNTLKYTGDVKITQNNFAGLGATGRGARGESFKTVSDGVRAHLQHLLMYAGEKIESPVAQRTRDIQEWGVLTKWQATISGPMTYSQLAKKWAPTSRGYPKDVATLAGLFFNGACKDADPHPEQVAEARKGRGVETDGKVAAAGKGAEIARQTIAEAREEGAPRSALGAGSAGESASEPTAASITAGNSPPVKIINAKAVSPAEATDVVQPDEAKADVSKPETAAATDKVSKDKSTNDKSTNDKSTSAIDTAAKETAAAATKSASDKPSAEQPAEAEKMETAALNVPALDTSNKPAGASDTPSAVAKCRVFTASYGGSKSIIIKAVAEQVTNYTVLDVNEGAEKREAEAYIGAYAKGGEALGDPLAQDKALEKAFELCPEG
ncbi:MAG: glucosaminidase domain-containing protein [Hyphomicrobium sp.]